MSHKLTCLLIYSLLRSYFISKRWGEGGFYSRTCTFLSLLSKFASLKKRQDQHLKTSRVSRGVTALSFHHPPFSPSHPSTTSFLWVVPTVSEQKWTLCLESFLFASFLLLEEILRASLLAQLVKNLPAMQEIQVRALNWDGPMEKGMATHSCSGLENWGCRVRCGWTTPTWNLELSLLTPVSHHLLLGVSPEPCGEPHQFSTRLWAAQAWSVREHRRVLTFSTLEEALVLSVQILINTTMPRLQQTLNEWMSAGS